MLWLVWATSNICMWANDVAAAWLMTSLTTSATLIAMVTTASSLPVFLLGLPSGALADIVDRRKYFMVTQVWVAINAAVLYLVSITVGLYPYPAAVARVHQRHRPRDALAGVCGDHSRAAAAGAPSPGPGAETASRSTSRASWGRWSPARSSPPSAASTCSR
jgi:MFS family permease